MLAPKLLSHLEGFAWNPLLLLILLTINLVWKSNCITTRVFDELSEVLILLGPLEHRDKSLVVLPELLSFNPNSSDAQCIALSRPLLSARAGQKFHLVLL